MDTKLREKEIDKVKNQIIEKAIEDEVFRL